MPSRGIAIAGTRKVRKASICSWVAFMTLSVAKFLGFDEPF